VARFPLDSLRDGSVHVWRAPLELTPIVLQTMWDTLAPDEIERARRFHFERHRHRFIAGRGILRALLSRYLDRPAGEIAFTYGPYGKPAVSDDASHGVRFNMAHSGTLVLVAVTRARQVGIDVEQRAHHADHLELARRFFAPGEIAELCALPPHDQPDGFLNCWTRKEAYLKARGDGLSLPLDSFTVSLRPGTDAALLWTKDGEQERARWDLRAVPAGAQWIGALVVERPARDPVFLDWDLTSAF
jgi:4'-phosphopantetheinyl transferase